LRHLAAHTVAKSTADSTLTATEAAALKRHVQALSGDIWSQALYDEMVILVESGWDSAGEVIGMDAAQIEASFDTIPATTLQAIRDDADQFGFLVNEREHQALFDVIDAAVADGQTPGELAGVISQTFAQGYHVDDTRQVPTKAWAKMVARTELNRAQTMGAMALYNAAGIEKVMFVTSQGSTVCDICEPLDGQIFDIDDVDAPPLHCNCACAIMAADEDVAYHSPTDEEAA
jgi:SPP1 gp7 family putative phage head morphogenesis protein